MSVYNSNEEVEKIKDAEVEEELDPRIQVKKSLAGGSLIT